MAKYSVGGGGGGDDGGSCELCGRETSNLQRANVAGADLLVCSDCAPHGDNRHTDEKRSAAERERDGEETDRKRRAVESTVRMYDASKGDSTRWEREGTDYEDDRLPYLVSGYGGRAETARQEAGLQVEELAADLGVDEEDLLAVEQGRAARAGVGGSVVRAIQERLEVELVEE